MTAKAKIGTRTVMAAIQDLKRGPLGSPTWPSAADLAEYLRVDVSEVRPCLRELKAQRLYDNRSRGGKSVWMPWNVANR